eukprot:GHVU01025474.1.p1 GENE.GHVU01025474.1~~GHVU01025474.1.p1  ORF type:complete len:194 (+),score=27.03 GHVU01025474.1:459-1040(+)
MPFSIAHRVEAVNDKKYLVQITLENVSASPIFVADAVLACADGVAAARLDTPHVAASRGYGGLFLMLPRTKHNVLFVVTPATPGSGGGGGPAEGSSLTLQVEAPFSVQLEVINGLDRSIAPSLKVDSKANELLSVPGPSNVPLGVLGPHRSKVLAVKAVALHPGIHQLQGISLVDASNEFLAACHPVQSLIAF